MSDRKRILIAGALESPHFRRWCTQLPGMPFEFHLLATCSDDPSLKDRYPDFIVHMPEQAPVGLRPLPARMFSRLRRMCGIPGKERADDVRRVDFFKRTLEKVRPHVLHSHGLNVNWQNQMELLHKARLASKEAGNSIWLYTSWGTDLDFFSKIYPEQDAVIRRILPDIAMLVTECDRDRRLAYEFGFRGSFWGTLPMFGGVDERLLRDDAVLPSERRLILVKGRDNQEKKGLDDPVGRARFILDVLEREQTLLAGYEIVVLQATPSIAERVAALAERGMAIFAPRYFASYNDVLLLFLRARAFLAMTVNDGLPSSLCEAMAAGAVPVHSNLESVAEWITDGENGILTQPDDVDAIAAALRAVIEDDAFVMRAAALNRVIVRERLLFADVREQVRRLYGDSVTADGIVRRRGGSV